jgi:tetratricopeptide (TPR) repeat protein
MDQQIKAAIINGTFVIIGVIITLFMTNNFPHLAPEDSYWNSQGNTFSSLEKYDQAVNAFDKALESNPKNQHVWRNRAVALAYKGEYEEALRSIDKAIEVDPKFTLALVDKSLFLVRLNRCSEADGALLKAEETLLS